MVGPSIPDIIVIDPEIMHGRACIKNTRIPVSLILNLLAHGHTITDIIADYPELTEQDVLAALSYASLTTR